MRWPFALALVVAGVLVVLSAPAWSGAHFLAIALVLAGSDRLVAATAARVHPGPGVDEVLEGRP